MWPTEVMNYSETLNAMSPDYLCDISAADSGECIIKLTRWLSHIIIPMYGVLLPAQADMTLTRDSQPCPN